MPTHEQPTPAAYMTALCTAVLSEAVTALLLATDAADHLSSPDINIRTRAIKAILDPTTCQSLPGARTFEQYGFLEDGAASSENMRTILPIGFLPLVEMGYMIVYSDD